MWELDSFLKESTRLDGILACEFCRLSHLYLNLSHTLQQWLWTAKSWNLSISQMGLAYWLGLWFRSHQAQFMSMGRFMMIHLSLIHFDSRGWGNRAAVKVFNINFRLQVLSILDLVSWTWGNGYFLPDFMHRSPEARLVNNSSIRGRDTILTLSVLPVALVDFLPPMKLRHCSRIS